MALGAARAILQIWQSWRNRSSPITHQPSPISHHPSPITHHPRLLTPHHTQPTSNAHMFIRRHMQPVQVTCRRLERRCCCCCSRGHPQAAGCAYSRTAMFSPQSAAQCDDAQSLLCAVPSPEEEALLLRGPVGAEEGEAFARALLFKDAKQQLLVIDTVLTFPAAAASVVQSCQTIRRCNYGGTRLCFVTRHCLQLTCLLQHIRECDAIGRAFAKPEVLA
jgi:hypothetical protein